MAAFVFLLQNIFSVQAAPLLYILINKYIFAPTINKVLTALILFKQCI